VPQQMIITLNDDGRINLQGPINNKIAAYGLLELAKDAIKEYHEQQARRVQPATPDQLAALTQQGNG
jgi:hypothetical protein